MVVTNTSGQVTENPVEVVKRTLSHKLSGRDLEECINLLNEGAWKKLTSFAFFLDAELGEDFVHDVEEIAQQTRFRPWRFRKQVMQARAEVEAHLVADVCCAGAEWARHYIPPADDTKST